MTSSLKNKKSLSKLNFEDLNLHPDTKLFISENLNKHFQRIGFESPIEKSFYIVINFKMRRSLSNAHKNLIRSKRSQLLTLCLDFSLGFTPTKF